MIRVISSGLGVQSMAMQILLAQGIIKFDAILFCNVGEDSENPDTLAYKNEVAIPHARKHGIEFVELHKTHRDGSINTLYRQLTRPGSRSVPIPVRMSGSGAPSRRSCTADYKILVVDKWLKEHTQVKARDELRKDMLLYAEDAKNVARILEWTEFHEPVAQVGLGISLDEIERVKPNTDPDTVAWKENAFPLIDEVEKPLTRQDCINIITRAGLPVPPKSSCWFCPYHKLSVWQEMRQDQPELFWKSVELEKFLNQRRASLGMDPVWFTRLLKPLEQATHEYGQRGLFDDAFDACESGYCMV